MQWINIVRYRHFFHLLVSSLIPGAREKLRSAWHCLRMRLIIIIIIIIIMNFTAIWQEIMLVMEIRKVMKVANKPDAYNQ